MKKIYFTLLLLSVLFLSGCAVALLGDGNGRPVETKDTTQRSIEQINVDAGITETIKTRYENDVVLKKLNVKTYRRVVTLYGNVPTRSVMERAVHIAQSTKGVVKVKAGLRLR